LLSVHFFHSRQKIHNDHQRCLFQFIALPQRLAEGTKLSMRFIEANAPQQTVTASFSSAIS
jgi:hypothetical protein